MIVSSFIFSSLGSLFTDACALLLIESSCFQMNLESFELSTESEKCLRLAVRIKYLILFRYRLSNVPRDYVGNKKRWDYMHEEADEEEEGELFGTPRQNIAMGIKESVKKKKQQPWVSFDEQ